MHDNDDHDVVSPDALVLPSSLLQLVFRIKNVKQIYKSLIAIDAICLQGSPNRIKPGEASLVFVRKETDRDAIQTLLGDSCGLTSTWTQFQDDNTHVVIWIDATKTLERNRKGVKLVECHQVERVFDGNYDTTSLTLHDMNNDLSQADTIHDKKERHCIFARWLVETYGMDVLSSGSGVVDVAGGNGELSHALVEMGVPSILLDPNPRCGDDVPFAVISQALHEDGTNITNGNDRDGDLVRRCSLIAGMHPDQATEPIVDMALRLGVPFAVLPCCVMPALFPRRTQKRSNDPVRSYSAFCQYLLDKAPQGETRFQVTHLPFVGRNKVIFLKNGGA